MNQLFANYILGINFNQHCAALFDVNQPLHFGTRDNFVTQTRQRFSHVVCAQADKKLKCTINIRVLFSQVNARRISFC